VPTISILLKQGDERAICSFSCVNVKLPNMNIVGEGYMGVTQSFFTLENTNLLHDYVKENNTIDGYKSAHSNLRQYGFLFDEKFEYYHGENCLNDYGHYGNNNLLVIGNRVKHKENLLKLFNDLNNSNGSITDRIIKSISMNKIVGFDNACTTHGLSSSSISFNKYDNKGDIIHYEYYVGTDIDPIDYLCGKLKSPTVK
jgi:uncharacterized Ntn-hydrolase superfamily protein